MLPYDATSLAVYTLLSLEVNKAQKKETRGSGTWMSLMDFSGLRVAISKNLSYMLVA